MGRMCGLSTVVTPAGASLTMYREIRPYANSIWDDNNNNNNNHSLYRVPFSYLFLACALCYCSFVFVLFCFMLLWSFPVHQQTTYRISNHLLYNRVLLLNQNAPRPSEHPPDRGKKINVKTFRWDQRLHIQNLFMAFKRIPR